MKSQLMLVVIAACGVAGCATLQDNSAGDVAGFYQLETSNVEGLVSLDLDLKDDLTYVMKAGILPVQGSILQRPEVGFWKPNKGSIILEPKTIEPGWIQAVPHELSLKTIGGGAYLVGANDAHHSLRKIRIVQRVRIDGGATLKGPNLTPRLTVQSGSGSS